MGASILQSSPIPLYHQLECDLHSRIEGGEFAPGDVLPTEEQICIQYGVSRITVRRALESLIAVGAIVKKRGVGSFVADRTEGVRSVKLSGSLDEFLATARSLVLGPISLGVVDIAPSEVLEFLGLKTGDKVVRLEMASSLSMGPVLYLEIYFPVEIGALLTLDDLKTGTPVVRVIERKRNTRVVRAQQLIEASVVGETAGGYLGLDPSTPVLRIRRVYYAAGDQPVEVAILKAHPERYNYLIDFRPNHIGY